MNLPSPLALDVLAEVAWVGTAHFEPHRWSALCWKLVEAGFATPTVSLLANEAQTMFPSVFEEAVGRAIDELGLIRFRDHEEADLIWKACRVLPAPEDRANLDQQVRTLVADCVRTCSDMDLLVGLGTLFEGMNLGPDDLDPCDLERECFVSDHCRRWADLNDTRIRPHLDLARRVFG